MTYLRIFGAICVLAGVFLLGMWLTWPGFPYNSAGFPINRKFIAISLNGQAFNHERFTQLATLEIKRSRLLQFRASGSGGCNSWYSDVKLLADKSIAWGHGAQTAVRCRAYETEAKYLRALHTATRWRTEEGVLILENDTDVIRYLLAPRNAAD
jgi:heat shock protein HslJ